MRPFRGRHQHASMCPEIQADPGNRETDPHGYDEPSFEARSRREQTRRHSDRHGNSQEDQSVAGQEALGRGLMEGDPERKAQGRGAEDDRRLWVSNWKFSR
jgi:hypothetical protein